jgi:pimeloyl-ACP methyl ester carboxylesterase
MLGVGAVVLIGASCTDGGDPDPAADPATPPATVVESVTSATGDGGVSVDVATFTPIRDGTNAWFAPDGTEVRFEVVIPPERLLGAVGPVLIAFPPGGQDLDLTRRIVDSDWRTEALARGVVVVSPAAPSSGLWFTDDSAAMVGPFLDAVAGGFPPTEGRFDLAGISNGGLSAFRTALEHPDRFRSLALAPGAPPADATDEQFAALAGMRISQFVGGDDASWLAQSQASHDRLAALGIDSVLEVIAGDDHFLDSLEPSRVWDALGL